MINSYYMHSNMHNYCLNMHITFEYCLLLNLMCPVSFHNILQNLHRIYYLVLNLMTDELVFLCTDEFITSCFVNICCNKS